MLFNRKGTTSTTSYSVSKGSVEAWPEWSDHIIRELLDQGSQGSFVTEATVQYLGLKKIPTTNKISGLGKPKGLISKAAVIIKIKSRIYPNVNISVRAYVLKCFTSMLPASKVELVDWKELKDLTLADPHYHTSNNIDILLGAK